MIRINNMAMKCAVALAFFASLSVKAADVTAPIIQFNQVANANVSTLSQIVIDTIDDSNVVLTGAELSNATETKTVSVEKINIDRFRVVPEYLDQDSPNSYTLAITAEDEFGNAATSSLTFNYVPSMQAVPDITLPAIASALRSAKGVPHNVLKTPLISGENRELAKGVHDIYFTLLDSAPMSLNVQGQLVKPGDTAVFQQNLSATNHRVHLVVYPEETGMVGINDYSIHIPNIRISVCPVEFKQKAGGKCTYLDLQITKSVCPVPFVLDEKGSCSHEIIYTPDSQCIEGYERDDLTCSGSYIVEPVSTCQSNYGLINSETCRQHSTIKAETCIDGKTFQDGMCTDDGQTFVPTGVYCNGKDLSSGNICEGATCTTYVSEWNACEITNIIPSDKVCVIGIASEENCLVAHSYALNGRCEFGFTRDNLSCSKVEIIPAFKTCDEGWELSEDQTFCMQNLYDEFIACPPTHELLDGRCHEIDEVIIQCPDTFEWNGSQCQRTVISDATPQCNESYVWDENASQCALSQVEDAIPQCPVDYVWVESLSRCEYTQTEPAKEVCESGFEWSDSTVQCEKLLEIPAEPVCDLPKFWNGTACQLDETTPAIPVCDNGMSWDGDSCSGFEVILATLIESCPDGTEDIGGSCKETLDETLDATPTYSCLDETWTLDGTTCLQSTTESETASSNYSCPDFSWVLSGTTCSRTIIVSEDATPTYNCPDTSWALDGTVCSRTTISTQPATIQYACPDASWALSGTSCSRLIDSNEPADVTYSCPDPSWTLSGSSCNKSTTSSLEANFNYQCPDPSWTLSGNSCSKSTSETIAANKSYSCPDPSWTRSGTTCSKRILVSSQAANFTYSCDNSGGWSLNGSSCTRDVTSTVSATQILKCQSGYSYNGSVCEENNPPVTYTRLKCSISPSCSSGYINVTDSFDALCSDGGTHYFRACQVDPPGTQPPTVSYSCPDPSYTLSGNSCTKTTSETIAANKNYYCADNSDTLVGSSCRKYATQTESADVSYYCADASYDLSGNVCTRTIDLIETASEDYYCPDNSYSLSGTTCSKTISISESASAAYSCSDPDARLDGSSCIIEVNESTAATSSYFCSGTGWTLDGTTCNKDVLESESASISFSCSGPGWSLDGDTCNKDVDESEPAINTLSCASAEWIRTGTTCERNVIIIDDAIVTYNCPNNTWTLTDSTCDRIVITFTPYDEELLCPETGGWTQDGNECSRPISGSPLEWVCDVDWTLDTFSCSKTSLLSPDSYSCDNPWVVNGEACNQLLTSLPIGYECTSPYLIDAMMCIWTQTSDVESYLCDDDWAVDSTFCRRTLYEPLIGYYCSLAGADLSGQECSSEENSPETRTCNTGWDLKTPELCRKDSPSDYVGFCPEEWTGTMTQCEKTINDDVTYYCSEEFELELAQCKRTLIEDMQIACSDGEELTESGQCIISKSVPLTHVCDAPYAKSGKFECRHYIEIDDFDSL